MPVTVSGPFFVTTTTVHLMLLPASTGFGEPTFDTARSMSGEMTTNYSSPHVLGGASPRYSHRRNNLRH